MRLLRIYPDLFDRFYPPETSFRDPTIRRDVGRWFWRVLVLEALASIAMLLAPFWVWEPLTFMMSFAVGAFFRLHRRAMRQLKD